MSLSTPRVRIDHSLLELKLCRPRNLQGFGQWIIPIRVVSVVEIINGLGYFYTTSFRKLDVHFIVWWKRGRNAI